MSLEKNRDLTKNDCYQRICLGLPVLKIYLGQKIRKKWWKCNVGKPTETLISLSLSLTRPFLILSISLLLLFCFKPPMS